jgi:hypothetical protein
MTFGFVIIFLQFRSVLKKINDIKEFRERFIAWANLGYEDQQAYLNLVADSPRIQTAMGSWGIIELARFV